jgi:hypothetical protein
VPTEIKNKTFQFIFNYDLFVAFILNVLQLIIQKEEKLKRCSKITNQTVGHLFCLQAMKVILSVCGRYDLGSSLMISIVHKLINQIGILK